MELFSMAAELLTLQLQGEGLKNIIEGDALGNEVNIQRSDIA